MRRCAVYGLRPPTTTKCWRLSCFGVYAGAIVSYEKTVVLFLMSSVLRSCHSQCRRYHQYWYLRSWCQNSYELFGAYAGIIFFQERTPTETVWETVNIFIYIQTRADQTDQTRQTDRQAGRQTYIHRLIAGFRFRFCHR